MYNIRHHLFLFICLFLTGFFSSSFAQENDVLMTIAGEQITKNDFLNVYNKNNRGASSIPEEKQKSEQELLNDYLELYINFKLKVAEAKELGLDTSKSFISELAGYRKQLAQPYLTDKEVNDALLQEAYERKLKDIRASHILVKVNQNALPSDTLAAFNKISKLRKRILKGESFEEVAKLVSEDPSAKENGGDLGYFTVFQMIYPFESMVYSTKEGDISLPVRTRYGYHIIKVNDVRNALGEVKVAHIMVLLKKGATVEDRKKAKSKIGQIYAKLEQGGDFAAIAGEYSEDRNSAPKAGELPWFSVGKMVGEFDKTVSDLVNIGDYSKPIQTQYGWHIIKMLDRRPIPEFEKVKAELKSRIAKDSRSKKPSSAFLEKLKKEYGFKEYIKEKNDFYKLVGDSYFSGNWKRTEAKSLDKTLFEFAGISYNQTVFANFIEKNSKKRKKIPIETVVNSLYNSFIEEICISYEDRRLSEKYPEFKALIQEYHDGILLFELTDQKVWSKAIKDTAGLRGFYEINKNNYMWPNRLEVAFFSCTDEDAAKSLRKLVKKGIKKGTSIDEIVNKANQETPRAKVKQGKFLKDDDEISGIEWGVGFTENVNEDKSVNFAYVLSALPPTIKTLPEAKGMITADYQTYLEKEWIEVLRKKYQYSVNKSLLDSIK